MNFRTIIQYIYVPGPPMAVSRKKSPEEELKAKLDELLGAILSQCKSVKGGALQKAIENQVNSLAAMAAGGDVAGALSKAGELEGFTSEAAGITKKLDDAILRAKSMMANLPPEAQAAMRQIIGNAERSLHSSTDLKGFGDVLSSVEMAANMAENILKGTPEKAAAAMRTLGVLADQASPLGADHVRLSDNLLDQRALDKAAADKGRDPLDDDALGELAQAELRMLPQP